MSIFFDDQVGDDLRHGDLLSFLFPAQDVLDVLGHPERAVLIENVFWFVHGLKLIIIYYRPTLFSLCSPSHHPAAVLVVRVSGAPPP